MTTRRDREESLLADMLHHQGDHRPFLIRLVELDTFQEVDATADRPSLVELALRQLNRSIHPSLDMAPFLLALLVRTAQPFQSTQPLAIVQQALLARQDALVAKLLDHPAAPALVQWHTARWIPAKRTHPADWTWPVALVRLLPQAIHPSLPRLIAAGWPAASEPSGATWLGHITRAHLPLAQAHQLTPSSADRILWGERFQQGGLVQADLDAFAHAWGASPDLTASPTEAPEATLLKLLKAGPTTDLRTNLERLSTPEQPWTALRVKDRGPANKQTLMSPVGWILLQLVRRDPKAYREPSWTNWETAMNLSTHLVPDREAAPGVTEGALRTFLKSMGSVLPAQDATTRKANLDAALAASEAIFCKGEPGDHSAPGLSGAAAKQIIYFWRTLHKNRYGMGEPVSPSTWVNWLERLFALGMGVPGPHSSDQHRDQRDMATFVLELVRRDEVPMVQRQSLLLYALATTQWVPSVVPSLCERLQELFQVEVAVSPSHPAIPRITSQAKRLAHPLVQNLANYLVSQERQHILGERPVASSAPRRPRPRS